MRQTTLNCSQVQIRHGKLTGGGRVDNWGPEKVRMKIEISYCAAPCKVEERILKDLFTLHLARWRNDVGRRLADLEIVLGTQRRELQVGEGETIARQDLLSRRRWRG